MTEQNDSFGQSFCFDDGVSSPDELHRLSSFSEIAFSLAMLVGIFEFRFVIWKFGNSYFEFEFQKFGTWAAQNLKCEPRPRGERAPFRSSMT